MHRSTQSGLSIASKDNRNKNSEEKKREKEEREEKKKIIKVEEKCYA